MKKILMISFVCLMAGICLAFSPEQQTGKPEKDGAGTDSLFGKFDIPPEPIGGMGAITGRIRYPEIAKRAGIEGKVIVTMIIDENGDVLSPSVLKSVDKSLDEAALEAIKGVKFKPATKEGKPVKAQISLPVDFKISEIISMDKSPREKLDEQPLPVGGMEAVMKAVKYPEDAIKSGLQGKVFVKVTIDEKGRQSGHKALSENSKLLNDAAIKAIKQVKFKPGKKGGKPVKADIVIPIAFKLR